MNKLVYIFFGVLALGCSRIGISDRLRDANSLIETEPDSAVAILKSIDTVGISDNEKATWATMLYKAIDKSYGMTDKLEPIDFAANFFRGRGDSLEVQALFYQGYFLQQNNDYGRALSSLYEAYEKSCALDDHFYAGMSAREMAATYWELKMVNEYVRWSKLAKEEFVKAGKPTHASFMDILIQAALIYSRQYEEASELISDVDTVLYNENDYFRNLVRLNKVELAISLEEYTEIIDIFNDMAIEGYAFTPHNYCRLAQAHIGLGHIDSADSLLFIAKSLPMQPEDSLLYDELKIRIFKAKENYKDAYETAYRLAHQAIRFDESFLTDPKSSILTENLKLRLKEERVVAEQRRVRMVWLAMLAIAMLAIAVFIFLFMRLRLRERRVEAQKLFNDLANVRLDLQKHAFDLSDTIAQNANLSQEIKRLEAEQSAKASSYLELQKGIYGLFSQQLEMYDNLCKSFYFNKDAPSNVKSHDGALIKQLKKIIYDFNTADKIDEMSHIIDLYDNDWMTNFKTAYPNLSEKDYQLVMLLYLRFSNETIALFLGKNSVQAIYVEKSRLKKKLLSANFSSYDKSFMLRIGFV